MRNLAGVALLLFALPLSAQITLSVGASFTTQTLGQPDGLAWGQVAAPLKSTSQNYVGQTITASGGVGITSSTPYSWTITDNGNTVETCSTSKCTTAGYSYIAPATHDGQIDASGDSTGTNATVVYNAPIDFPSTLSPKVCATDHATPTPNTTCATAVISPGFLPASLLTHRGRMLGINNLPWTIWALGTSPQTYQSLASYFPNQTTPGTWMGFASLSPSSVNSPVTAGSSINRPSWSYNGRWFVYDTAACIPSTGCPNDGNFKTWIQQADGAGEFNSKATDGANGYSTFTWDVNQPNWLLVEYENAAWPSPSTGNLDVVNMLSPATGTTVLSYTSTGTPCNAAGWPSVGNAPCEQRLYSQMGGTDNARNFLKEANYSECTPTASCAGGGGGPKMTVFDMSACEASLAANCATVESTWSINLGLGSYTTGAENACDGSSGGPWPGTSSYYDENGNPHQVYCEFGTHSLHYVRGTDLLQFNYGTFGSGGEILYFQTNDDGTGVEQFYANQTTTINRPFMGHPAWASNGGVVVFSGYQYCNATGNVCNTSGTGGIGYWEPSLDGSCVLNPTFPACGLVQWQANLPYGHSAYDGFNLNLVGHDDGGGSLVGGYQHELMNESFWNLTGTAETLLFDWGNRPQNSSSGNFNFSIIDGPVQSPDATKLAESIPMSVSEDTEASPVVVSNNVWFQVGYPEPPVSPSLPSTSAATIQWFAPSLAREAQLFWVWKQPSCSGAWTRLASVNAVYMQSTAYSYTDSALGSGQNACYGLTTQEWSGAESNLMSAQLGITNTAGSFAVTSTRPAGTAGFDTAPDPVSGLSAAAAKLCATGCAATDTPSAPTVNPATGGSLATGAWSTEVTYVKYAAFPAIPSNGQSAYQTLPSAATATTLSGSNDALSLNISTSEMVGQDGFCVYDSGPSDGGTYWLDGCFPIPDGANGASSGIGAAVTETITSHNTSGSNPPGTATATGGYSLSWTAPTVTAGLRFNLILYRTGSAPSASDPWPYEIAAIPASATSYYDAYPNQAAIVAGSPDIYYAVETLDASGLISSCVAYNATTSTTASCQP